MRLCAFSTALLSLAWCQYRLCKILLHTIINMGWTACNLTYFPQSDWNSHPISFPFCCTKRNKTFCILYTKVLIPCLEIALLLSQYTIENLIKHMCRCSAGIPTSKEPNQCYWSYLSFVLWSQKTNMESFWPKEHQLKAKRSTSH